MLGFNLKTRKAKQSATGSYLCFSLKMVILPPGIFRMRLSLKPVMSCFIFFFSPGIKGVHHYCLGSMAN